MWDGVTPHVTSVLKFCAYSKFHKSRNVPRCRRHWPVEVTDTGGNSMGWIRHIYVPFFTRHLDYWVGVPSVYQTDLRGDIHDIAKGG